MSQQGIDFCKKISKKKIKKKYLTFTDVHTDRQKLGTILENKVVQKLKFSTTDNNKKSFSKLFDNPFEHRWKSNKKKHGK